MKKQTGIIRRIDDLGRIVIPKALREQRKIKDGQPLEIFMTEKGFVLEPYYPDGELNRQTKAEIAAGWLKTNYHKMDKYHPQFSIKGKTITCKVAYSNIHVTGAATCSEEDNFDFNIGAIIAFCRAIFDTNNIPEEFFE